MRLLSINILTLFLYFIPIFFQTAFAEQHYYYIGKNPSDNMGQVGSVIDSQFSKFSNSFTEAQTHRALSSDDPAESLNVDFSFEMTSTRIERDSIFEDYSNRETPDMLYIPKFQFNTEFSRNWNMGAFYSSIPDSGIQIYGGELRYSMFSQHTALPAVSVRGTYTQLTGVEDMFVTSRGLELAVSKGFDNITPYAGFGTTWVDGEYQLSGYTESLLQNKYFLGMQFNLGMFTFAAETEQNGESSSTNAKFGVKF